jgi:glutamine---fructose-6-phosphate transaminase (isomerizing)
VRVDEHLELRWENMLAGIRRQPEWLRRGPRQLLAEAAAVRGDPPPRVYLTGCGDSHYAGLAARQAFEGWSGIPTQALPSLELARYEVELAPAGAWAICVSNSGRVVRTIEAATGARERGLTAIAVTYDRESRLARGAEATIAYGYDDPGFGPGTISYVASLTALFVLALRAGELAGRLGRSEIEERLGQLEAQAEAAALTIERAGAVAERLGRELPLEARIDVLGGGPSLGTAFFGRAKLIEAARVAGGAHELEEWAHAEFFCTGPGTVTIVVAPPGASADRAAEQLDAARAMGAVAVAVCPPGTEAAAAADVVLPVAGDPPEELSPFAYCVPLELLAYHFASSKGLTMLGFDDERRRDVNFRQIFGAD